MSDFFSESATVGVVISFLMYYAGLAINKKTKLAILNPLLLAIIGVIAFLLIFNIDYEVYNSSAKYLSYLLTPATVSLAIPMYQKLELLKREPIAILSGIVSGVIASLLSVFALSLESVWAAIGGVIILSEKLSTKEIIGCVLVFLAVLIAELEPQKSST